jgi:hypothetical protein
MINGNGFGPTAALMDEVDLQLPDRRLEVVQLVQPRFRGAPIVDIRPVRDELARVREVAP